MTLQVPMVLKRFQPRGFLSRRGDCKAGSTQHSGRSVKDFGTQSECIEHSDYIHGKRTFGQIYNDHVCRIFSSFPFLTWRYFEHSAKWWHCTILWQSLLYSNPPCLSIKTQGILYLSCIEHVDGWHKSSQDLDEGWSASASTFSQ